MAVKGWTMAAVAVVVAAGTYFTLEALYPPTKNGNVDLRVVSPDSVFGNAPVDADGAGAAVAALEPAKTPDAHDRALDAAMAPSEDNLVVTDESLAADEPEPVAAPPADAALETGEAAAAEDEAADDTAEDTVAEAAATPSPAVATPAPAPTPTPTATAAPEPSATPAATAQPKPRSAPARTPAPRITQWWGPESDANLSVIYAGSAAYTRAIVLMFNGAFRDAASAQQHLRVHDATGKAVPGSWEVGASNRRMLVFPVAQTGIYTVTVGAGLADQAGRVVGKEQQGPVRVQ